MHAAYIVCMHEMKKVLGLFLRQRRTRRSIGLCSINSKHTPCIYFSLHLCVRTINWSTSLQDMKYKSRDNMVKKKVLFFS